MKPQIHHCLNEFHSGSLALFIKILQKRLNFIKNEAIILEIV
jgi:hypothetical protein